MSRRQRNWAVGLGAFGVVVVIAIVLFDWNWFKPLAEARASAALGRPVSIGNLDVKLSRVPLIVLDRITVKNPEAFAADSQMAEIERISVRVELGKLLRGQVSLPELIIDKPIARLEPGPDGKPNWKLADRGGSGDGTPPEIHQLTINDGEISFRDPELKADVKLGIQTEVDPKGGPSKIVVSGRGKYSDAPTRVELRAGSLLSLQAEDVRYPISLQWEVGSTRIKLDGTVHNPANFAGLDGTLDLKGPDLEDLYPLIGIPLPPSPPYHLNGKITYADRQVGFQDFKGTLGSSDLSGTLSVDIRGERPRLEGDLVSQKVLLADLAGFIGGTPGRDPSEARKAQAKPQRTAANPPAEAPKRARERAREQQQARALPNRPIDLQKLNAADVNVRYRGKRVEVDYLPLDNIDAKLNLENGRFRLQPLNFGIGKGTMAMNVDIDGRAAPPKVAVDAEFRNVDLNRIMRQTKMFEGQGLVGGRAKVTGTGSSVAEVLGRGNGGIAMAMTGGSMSSMLTELTGIDLGEALGLKVADPARQYAIRCMVVDAALDQGVLRSKSVVIDTTDTIIVGGGTINFQEESLHLRLEPHPKDVSILTFRTPFDITGTLKHPQVRPDMVMTGGRIAAMIGLGIVATPLAALIPTIEMGLGEDSDCKALIAQVKGEQGKPKPSAVPTR